MKQRKLIALLCALSMIFTLFVPAGAETTIKAGLQEDGSFLIGDFTDSATAKSFRTTSAESGTGHYNEPPLNYMCLNWTSTNGAQGEGYMAANQDVFASLDFSGYGIFSMDFAIEKRDWETQNSINNFFTIVLSTAPSGALPKSTYYQNECLFYEVDLSKIALTGSVTKASVSALLSDFQPAFDGMVNNVEVAEKKDGKVDLKDIKSISIMGGAFGIDPDGSGPVAKYPGNNWTTWTFINAGSGALETTCGFGVFKMELTKQATVSAKEIDTLMAGYTKFVKNTTIELPKALTNATVSWTSSNPAVISTDGVVTMAESDTDVTLTATVLANDGTTATKTYTMKVYGSKVLIKAGKQADGSYLIGDFSDKTTGAALVAGCNATNSEWDRINYWVPLSWHTDGIGSRFENYIYNNPVAFADLDFSEYGMLSVDFAIAKNFWEKHPVIKNCFSIVLSTAEKDATRNTYYENECLFYEVDLSKLTLTGAVSKFNVEIPLSDFTVAFDGMKNGVQGETDGKVDLKDIKSFSIMGQGFKNAHKSTLGTLSPTQTFKNSGADEDVTCAGGLYSLKLLKKASVVANELDSLMAGIDRVAKNTTLDLPKTLTDATVSWSSNYPAIISNEGVVVLPENNTDVTLTATVTANDGTTATKTYTVKVFGTNGTKLVAGKQADGSYLIGDFSDVTTATAMKDGSAENSSIDTINKWYTLGWLSSGICSRAENYIYNNPVTFADLDFSEYGMFSMDFAISKQLWQKYPSIQNYFTIVLSTAEKDAQRSNYKNNECLYYEVDLSKYTLTGETSKFNLTVPFSEFTLAFDGMVNGAEVAAKKDGKINLADIKSISILGADFGSKWVSNGTGCNLGTTWTFKNSSQDNADTCGGGLYNIKLLKQASIVADELDVVMADYDRILENTTINLPDTLKGATVTWSSDNEAVLNKNGVAVMQENDTVVTLVADITAPDGSSAKKTYKITVCGTNYVKLVAGKQADGSYLLGDFTTKEMAEVFKVSGAENTTGGWDSVNKFFSMNWTVNTGSRGENYIYNNPVVFKDLDFSEYGIFNIKFAIDRTNYEAFPTVENYMTVVLTTAKKDAVPLTYCENECLYYEINLRDYPITGGTKRIIDLSIPFSEFKVAFASDGIVNLEDIKSVSLVAGPFGSRIKNGPGATDSPYWTFTNSGAAAYDANGNPVQLERCGAGLYSMSLSNYAVSKPVIYSGDAEFTDMNTAALVYGKADCIVTNGTSKVVSGVIALYKGGQLKAVETGDITLANGTISTEALSYDPANYDKVSVYLWDKATMAPVTVNTTLNK